MPPWSRPGRLAAWLLPVGFLVIVLSLGRNTLRAAVEHNAGYLALNRALALNNATGQTANAWRARGVAWLSSAAARRPDRSATWRALGHLYALEGDEEQAVVAWQNAGDMRPEFLLRAQEAEAAGRFDEAHDWYWRMAVLVPDDPATWLELALFHERQSDWAAEAEVIERGLASARVPNGDLLYHLAFTQRQVASPDWVAILDATERALATDAFFHDWSRLQTHRLRAEALSSLGRLTEARDEYIWVVERRPDDYWANLLLGELVWKLDGDVARAEQLFRAALALDSGSKWGYRYLAQFYADRGLDEQARALFERVQELDPADPIAGAWLNQH